MGNTILLCDDSVIVRSGLEAMFKKSGNWERVLTAENGKVGLQKILDEKPDVVCLDVEMPEMDGISVLKEVGKLKKEGRIPSGLPVVILSGTMYENDSNVRKAKMFGAADVMAKPEGKSATISIDFQDLEKRILVLL